MEAWETNAAGPYVTIECPRGVVSIWAAGGERHRVIVEGDLVDEVVAIGHDTASEIAHDLARLLGGR